MNKKIFPLLIFSIAMGYMEAAVVVYLRTIYYPDGFDFPLTPMESSLALTEVFREVATIIMLLGIAIIAGKNRIEKFAYFLFCFAIWDIFYYIFLKLILDWPASLVTPDILFLIPVPWVGPVLAPCLVSLDMVILSLLIIQFQEKKLTVKIDIKEALLLLSGSLIIVFSFMWDYIRYTSEENKDSKVWTPGSDSSIFSELSNYVPLEYNWWLFSIGQILIILGLITFFSQNKSVKSPEKNSLNKKNAKGI